MTCAWCEEPILPGERIHTSIEPAAHLPCGLRMILGSVAHVQGRCRCFVKGSTESDPEGMTKRQAAAAAVKAYFEAEDAEIARRAKLEMER